MNGWENTEKIVKFYHLVFPPATFVFRNNRIHQQFDIICLTYISNTCILSFSTHYWWVGDDETLYLLTHVTLHTCSYVIAAMLFIILPTCHIYLVIKHLSC